MRARSLTVLMWKHGVVRIRKFIHSTVDLLAPIVFFLVLFSFKDNINPQAPSEKNADHIQSNTETIRLTVTLNTIIYHPDTPLTGLLMDEVGQKLGMERLKTFPNRNSYSRGYFPYKTNTELDQFTSIMQRRDAIVEFQNMAGDTWPDKLNYTIRMKNNFHTYMYEAWDAEPGPHAMFGQDYFHFMRLQWAIDSSYIKTQSGKDINQSLSIQEFPYYRTPKHVAISFVCKMLSAVCWLSLLLAFVFLMCRLLEERASGVQELIKMVGVSMNTLGLSHFLNVLPPGLVFSIMGTILLKCSSNPLIPNSNAFLIFLVLLLYYTTIVALAIVCSYLVGNSEYAVTVSVVSYGLLWVPARLLGDYHTLPYAVTLLTGLLPHVPLQWFWQEVGVLELYNSGATFGNMFFATNRDHGSVFLSIVFLLLQALVFYGLAWYLSLVRPGKYGQALPWNFLFKKQFWTKNEVKPDMHEDSDSIELMSNDDQYFEQPPEDLKIGIKVDNVSKDYPKHKALKNVSLNAYHGEITVLVGHNGAGKTTLMSIITGMTSATDGNVYVNGMDTVTQKDEVRKHIGLCPQHNMFFPDLTLQEHIMFFTLLKQGTYQQARDSSRKLAGTLGLEHKLGVLSAALSGGMKRRAQLACALAGGADVLVLDEPTSGLDVETRRELWDLLLSLRGSRTVLLSTHFMEEADALGDRVAALHAGTLRCFATTMHLKRAIGTGYRLSLTTIGLPKEDAITEEVHNHVADATIKEKTINSLSFNLPATANNLFPHLFAALEGKRSELGIDSIGVGVSTLEEVFLKLCSDVDTTVVENGVDTKLLEATRPRLTGIPLYWRQLGVLLFRHLRFAYYRKWVFLTMQIILPVTLIFLVTHYLNNSAASGTNVSLRLSFDVYSNVADKRVLYNVQLDDKYILRTMNDEYSGVELMAAGDVADTILDIGKKDTVEYNKYLAGIELNETNAKALFTTTVRHAAPISLNMLSNLLAMHYLDWPKGQILAYNHPIDDHVRRTDIIKMPKDMSIAILWAVIISFFIQTTNLQCVSLPCRERETGTRHIHIMSGCPAELHWAATLMFHMAFCLLFLVLPSAVSAYSLDLDDTFNQPDFILALAVILTAGSLALFAFMYLISFSFNERNTNLILVPCLFIFGLVFPLMKAAYDFFGEESHDVMYYILLISSYVSPPHTLVAGLFRCVAAARNNAWCPLLHAMCPDIELNEPAWTNLTTQNCCAGKKAQCYFCMDDASPTIDMLILFAQFVFLMTLVVLTERGVFNGLWDWLKNVKYRPAPTTDHDQMVRAEKTYVEKEITKPVHDIKKDSMLVDNIHKNYASLFKSCNAVRGVSFSVKKGECFGLLGVNGAGKSTTFKMLTAEECTTRGKIFSNGHHLKGFSNKYLQTLGYCPQFFGLDMFLTGEENLALVLTLRGFDRQQVKREVQDWIEIVGLEKYARRTAETYSGGCVRRLGTAAALCGGAELTLLDEPSAGVDVAARRRMWAALRKALAQQRAIIITSHSMDEMESLCSRIAIMCSGQVRALGTPAALRAAHAAGHAVVFKVKSRGDEVDGPASKLNLLKGKLLQKFNCSLKDEHRTMLHYHINETMRYSELFSALELLRGEFPSLIEDYSVTETTLEEVFLAFAKEEKTVETA